MFTLAVTMAGNSLVLLHARFIKTVHILCIFCINIKKKKKREQSDIMADIVSLLSVYK